MSNNSTFLFYDKAVDNNNQYDNLLTKNISIESIFLSEYNYIEGYNAIIKINKLHLNNKIPINLDMNIYNVFLFQYKNNKHNFNITILEIKNEKIKNYVINNEKIPNKDFLIIACNYHTLYEKARQNINIVDKEYEQKIIENNINEIAINAMIPVTSLTDEMEKQPWFSDIELFNYQKRTIKWMITRENNNETVYRNKNGDILFGEVLYNSNLLDIVATNKCESLTFKGGVLNDEVGLGKTCQAIMLSLLNKPKNINYIQKKYNKFFSKATLIICPSQLGKQWDLEIDKLISKKYGVNKIIFFVKTQYEKYTYQDLLDADFVITTYNFLINKCFTESWVAKISPIKSYLNSDKFYSFSDCKKIIDTLGKELMKNLCNINNIFPNLLLIHWNRIICDEFPEIYTNKKLKTVTSILPLFCSNYYWCLTATPFNKPEDSLNMLKFVTHTTDINIDIFGDKNIYNYMTNNFFRRNTKKSVLLEHELLPLKETIIWLNFSKIEWMIYNAYLANPQIDKFEPRIRQICCYPKLSKEIQKVAYSCKSLDEIEKVMVEHYETEYKNICSHISDIKTSIEKVQIKINNLNIERKKKLLESLNYKVIIETDEKNIDFDITNNNNNNNKKKIFVICDKNEKKLEKLIGNELKKIPTSISEQLNNIANLNLKLSKAEIECTGKKSTYDYYIQMIEKLKSLSTSNNDCDDNDNKCGICLENISGFDLGVTICMHMFCYNCVESYIKENKICPICRHKVLPNEFYKVEKKISLLNGLQNKDLQNKQDLINIVGTKLANLILLIKKNNVHSIIFSQWDDLLKKVGEVLTEHGIKNVFCKGNVWQMNKAIDNFNTNDDIKIIMLSLESSASGTNLTKAKMVICYLKRL
jgi:SNF2 family DNA or RNA helicase